MTALPDLHGWLPAAALARAEGVHPSTIRRRGDRGVLEVVPNPYGGRRLYRENRGGPAPASDYGSEERTNLDDPASAPAGAVRAGDVLVLHQLPGSVTRIARQLGWSKGSVQRALLRLEAAGLVTRGESVPPGPRGGRPEILWRAVS